MGDVAEFPRRTQADRSRITKDALLQAAVRCVREYGYAATTLAQVAARASVSKGALQHHFADKRDLMASVVEFGWNDAARRLQELSDIEGSIPERVDAVLSVMWTSYSRDEARAALEISLAARKDLALRTRTAPHHLKSRETLDREWARLFQDAPADPEQVRTAWRLALTLITGIMLQTAFEADSKDILADIDLMKRTITELLLAETCQQTSQYVTHPDQSSSGI